MIDMRNETLDTITKRQTRKLIRALESGNYHKTKGKLCNKQGTAFCCLGVYADIQGATWEKALNHSALIPVNNLTIYGFLGDKWAGGLSKKTQNVLAIINDDSRGFKKVIDYLKKKVLPNAI